MQPDPRKYLWDALRAAGFLRQFAAGKTFAEYQDDVLLRSAVERQFEIVGEALSQLAKTHTDMAAQVPELRRIVAFRNILIHGYANVDDALVWQVLTDKLPQLETAVRTLLAESPGDPESIDVQATPEETGS
ncbi:HepT-like ribonuclease domain-containing protein [Mycobacterium kansasii]|uniref:DUF86 domain-containing protein n=3 Tax=Mycobacterium kansasii TaxID=1768 RepID=A0A1V3WAR2_MYCKA|nr:DUF86 domain-containing protein [Mycobacterium kansasii]EUA00775.1 hypothetical protein I547_4483 [Mycobacterium kansasii 824]AGZ49611.1 hypothetical protein MKAN_04390 [Mycobacterium kansasii ATCC 12478]ARG58492.1 hypothetical protein B1T43_24755 [Mycobacterium kansasii]ARG63979.1 hypothetical protein B1T45_25135 [Mycobacterium kansasii]ARG71631.1 hypothetical protein B1T47_24510 [Mycobacterium kansasii]